jgi:hypothetical protein
MRRRYGCSRHWTSILFGRTELTTSQEDEEKKSTKTGRARKDHDKNKGVALAARHFDKTGVRITPREALRLAEGK